MPVFPIAIMGEYGLVNIYVMISGGVMAIARSERSLTYRVDDLPGGSSSRLKEMILYISNKCKTNETYGKTKLNKILYFSDFKSFHRRGVPITGTTYQKLAHGPAPVAMCPVQEELTSMGHLVCKPTPYQNKMQHRLIALRKPDLSIFSRADLDIVDEVIKELWNLNADDTSKKSHGIAYRLCDEGVRIPYEASFLAEPHSKAKISNRARDLGDKYGW